MQKSNSKNKEIIYIADSGRFPYGTKSPEQIIAYTEQIIHWLEQKEVDQIVFGCNTASAIAGKRVLEMTQLPVLDLVDPVARYLSQLGLKVGILATQATVNSHAFAKAIKSYAPQLSVQEIASAELVNIVEKGDIKSKETKRLLTNYLEQFACLGTQIIVLSCTHFSFLKDIILELVDKDVQILDPAEVIVQMLLPSQGRLNSANQNTKIFKNVIEPTFFVTGDREAFCQTAAKCLGYPIKNVNQLSIKDLESLHLH